MSKPNPFELARATQRKGPRCSVAVLREELDNELLHHFDAAMADRKFDGSTIARTLTELGYPIKNHTICRHRNGDCSCG